MSQQHQVGPDPRRAEIGRRIARARKNKGLSQSELAAKAGVESQTISKYERGVLSPGAEVVFRIADACEVDPRLLALVDEPAEPAEDVARTGTEG